MKLSLWGGGGGGGELAGGTEIWKTLRTISRATSEDSDHLPMQGRSDFAICGDKKTWRDYKSLVKYTTISVKV